MENQLKNSYLAKKNDIKLRLQEFQKLPEKERYYELLFCILTPQSKAQKCWEAVTEIKKIKQKNTKNIRKILKKKTRFHNNKTNYILKSEQIWPEIQSKLQNSNIKETRNWIAENVYGIGLKEAGHFLRNIGKSDNQIAILDRHILRNMKKANIISDEKIKSNKHYLEIEEKFLNYAKFLNIPADELDLLFWSQENGEIFK